MKLIKINTDHYVIVDGSIDMFTEPVGSYYLHIEDGHISINCITKDTILASYYKQIYFKITHSTQPNKGMENVTFISPREVKELIGEVDVEKKAEKFIGCEYEDIEDNIDQIGYDSFIRGYNQALEDNKEKKWTDEDVIYFVNKSRETGLTAEYLMLTKQPKTEWEVELIDGQLKLKQ